MKRNPEHIANRNSVRAGACLWVGLFANLCLSMSVFAGISVETLTIERDALPGETYQGVFTVTNTGDASQNVSLYQSDYLFFADGTNRYDNPGTDERSNAGWMVFSPNRALIPPKQSTQISYVVHVPADSSLTGSYWSMLMVEEIEPDMPDSLIHLARYQTAIRQVVRYGVQCVTNVGPSASEKLAFSNASLTLMPDSSKQLQVDVGNVGQRLVVPTSWVELYDQAGRRVGRYDGEKKRIYPGTSVRLRIPLSVIPGGKYKALVVLDNGEQNVFGAKYDLEF
jgi:hypothetical protein